MPSHDRIDPPAVPENGGKGNAGDLREILSHLSDSDMSRTERDLLENAPLREIRFEPRQSTVTIVMDLPADLSDGTISRIELAAVKAIPGLKIRILRCGVKGPSSVAASQESLVAAWEEIVTSVKLARGAAVPWLLVSRPRLDADLLEVVCADEVAAARLRRLKCDELFLEIIAKRWAGLRQVRFVAGNLELPPPRPARAEPDPGAAPAERARPLMGAATPLRADALPIHEVPGSARYAVVEGMIFNPQVREGRKRIFSAGITDFRDSLRLKVFDPPDALLTVKDGETVRVGGRIEPDSFENNEPVLTIRDMVRVPASPSQDPATEKRIEWNCHTKFSRLNGLIDMEDLVETVKRWGWEGFVVSDDAVVQSFPRLHSLGRAHNLKIGLGCQMHCVDDRAPICREAKTGKKGSDALSAPAVVFDLETTGLSALTNRVIEVAAYRVENGRITDEFQTFVNPHESLSETVSSITHITDEMLADAPDWSDVLPRFRRFIGDAALVAHNVSFDAGFLRRDWPRNAAFPALVDTLGISRALFKGVRNYTLGTIARELAIPLVGAHRAAEDARALARIWIEMLSRLKERGITRRSQLESLRPDIEPRKLPSQDVVAVVSAPAGLKNLYRLVTAAHLEHLYIRPRVPASLLAAHRDGLLVGSGATEGPVVEAILAHEDPAVIEERARSFDYIEVAPPELYRDRIAQGSLRDEEGARDLVARIVALGRRVKRPVIAVSKAYHLERHELLSRRIVRTQKSAALPSHHLRTTAEMLEDFAFLGEEEARRIVIEEPRDLFARIESVSPLPAGFFPPVIDGAEKELREETMRAAAELYGGPKRRVEEIPPAVMALVEKELKAIIGNGFSVLYLIAMRLVRSSLKNQYVVGSRGSVGSSVVAFLIGITEVNPLPPHYRCASCRRVEFIDRAAPGSPACGPDMPPRSCCGAPMTRDGFDIPFEAFMGWEGKKVPDIDLNFAGEYQARAMQEIEETFGRSHVFRAGTINTLKEKNACGLVRKHLEENGLVFRSVEIERHARTLTEVSRTTGQHPGGMVIIPRDREITDFMPVQRPADSESADAVTTHFDFHSYEGTVVKVDVLGHDAPTAVRMLAEMTGIDPMTVPLDDPGVISLLSSPRALGLTESRLGVPVGTLAIPELGTPLVTGILAETRPRTVEELIRISGLSHGEGVWKGNAQDLIKSGRAKLSEVIATREDIMNGLVRAGLDPATAFAIMERVRKGKGLAPKDEAVMKKHRVPAWILESCRKIRYMFPKAHAVAYVMMALRIAWFKVNRPEAFYATWFTLNCADFSLENALLGEKAVTRLLSEIRARERERKATPKEEAQAVVYEVVREMLLRGIALESVSLEHSDALRFRPGEKTVRAPLLSVEGLGEKVARRIATELAQGGITSIDDLAHRAGLSRPIVERLKKYGAFGDLPDSNQMVLF